MGAFNPPHVADERRATGHGLVSWSQ